MDITTTAAAAAAAVPDRKVVNNNHNSIPIAPKDYEGRSEPSSSSSKVSSTLSAFRRLPSLAKRATSFKRSNLNESLGASTSSSFASEASSSSDSYKGAAGYATPTPPVVGFTPLDARRTSITASPNLLDSSLEVSRSINGTEPVSSLTPNQAEAAVRRAPNYTLSPPIRSSSLTPLGSASSLGDTALLDALSRQASALSMQSPSPQVGVATTPLLISRSSAQTQPGQSSEGSPAGLSPGPMTETDSRLDTPKTSHIASDQGVSIRNETPRRTLPQQAGTPPQVKPSITQRSKSARLPTGRGVNRVPATAMYLSNLPSYGTPPSQALRGHTASLVGDQIWFIGGIDANKHCWRGVACFDTESLSWMSIDPIGETMPPRRSHSATPVGQLIYIFGGGNGPTYSNDVWIFDTARHRFWKPALHTPRQGHPPPRRAHTAVLYRNFVVVFGGGNGQAALNDVWALDVSDPARLTWSQWQTSGDPPQKKGYHTANLVGDRMIIFGGSDGHASFADIHVLDLNTLRWTLLVTETKHNRLTHTSTQVGSYLFVLGGNTGQTYAQDVLLFNLVTLQWESKSAKGLALPGRSYHTAILHDARVFIAGGFNGTTVFDDLWALDLGAAAYLPQITTFESPLNGR